MSSKAKIAPKSPSAITLPFPLAQARRKAFIIIASPHLSRPTPAFPEALDAFLAQSHCRPSTHYTVERCLRKHFKFIRTLDKITHEDIAKIIDPLPRGAAGEAVKNIRAFFNWCSMAFESAPWIKSLWRMSSTRGVIWIWWAIQVLKDFGRITHEEIEWREPMSFKTDAHDMMVAYCTASIELGAKVARFIPWTEILGSPKCPQETKHAKRPLEIKVGNNTTIPDAIFGIETQNSFTFYALECDRATESIESVKRTSFAGKIALYREIFKNNIYKSHFGFSNMLMLTVTISDLHLKRIMEYVERTYTSGTKPFCFKTIPSLNPYINNPPITGHLFIDP